MLGSTLHWGVVSLMPRPLRQRPAKGDSLMLLCGFKTLVTLSLAIRKALLLMVLARLSAVGGKTYNETTAL